MTFTADEPVESGCSYRVTEVDGHRPDALSDFAGDTRLTLVRGGMIHLLVGDGATTGGVVRFHQKDRGPDDRDVRVWSSPIAVMERFSPSQSPHSDDHIAVTRA